MPIGGQRQPRTQSIHAARRSTSNPPKHSTRSPARACWRLASLLLLVASLVAPSVAAQSELEGISAERYIVVDAETGEVFAAKDADERGGMASLTKIFTIMEAIERVPLDTEVVAQESDLFDAESTRMTGFEVGETYTVEDLLYGMMLESGNDAAQAVARTVGFEEGDTPEESVERFVGWMNERVRTLGLADTQLRNPHGLSQRGHYSTPRDLAAFTMYALENETFVDILSATSYTTSTGVTLQSINRGPEFISDLVGGKTGYDDATGYCLIEVVDAGSTRLLAVTIDGDVPDVWYQDHALLFDAGAAALEERLEAGRPISGEVVSFVRPQAAKEAPAPAESAGGGQPAEAAAVQVTVLPTAVPISSVPDSLGSGGSRSISGDWPLAGALALLLSGFAGLRVLAGSLRQTGLRPFDTSRSRP